MAVSHLHLDDYPVTLALLGGRRATNGTTRSDLPTSATRPPSTARTSTGSFSASPGCPAPRSQSYTSLGGVAILERHGGPSLRLSQPLREAIAAVTPDHDLPPEWVGER